MKGLESVFISLTDALMGAPMLALGAAFAWGVLGVVLSPCHLASIPLIVAYLQGGKKLSTARAAGLSTLFAVGILISIILVGAVTAAAGRMMGDVGPWGIYAVALVFFLFGLHLLGWLPLPENLIPKPTQTRGGPLGAMGFGLAFGIALGPCTFAFMAPVLGITFGLAGSQPIFAFSLAALFALGHCFVISFAGVSSTWVQRWLNWQNDGPSGKWMRRCCGLLVLLGGFYLVTTA